MSQVRVDSASRLVAASRDKVFAAFADGDSVAQWLPPEGAVGRVDVYEFREAGAMRMTLFFGDDYSEGKSSDDSDVVDVVFGEIVAGERIEWLVNFESDKAEFAGTMRMVWQFSDKERGTRVRISAYDVPPGIGEKDHEAALRSSLDNLARFVAG